MFGTDDTHGGDTRAAATPRASQPQKNVDTSAIYHFVEPPQTQSPSAHFSSLLMSGSVTNTMIELTLLVGITILSLCHGVNTTGSMPLRDVGIYLWSAAVFRRLYNTYLEACYFSFPKYRTQPANKHKLHEIQDLNGRDLEQLEKLKFHDALTIVSQFALELTIYWMIPGFYPVTNKAHGWFERVVRLVANHYVLSFGMYWMHRSLHANKFLWDQIHSFHHWARHPLSRNTYEDHWLDNLANAIVGHGCAQILVPLDRTTFFFSRFLRIMESLEKHSGISCHLNLAHTCQGWLPFAQMPHHHDWHHEGHKGCNYTFAALGGVWDCIFNTRRAGRFTSNSKYAATREDLASDPKSALASDPPYLCLVPVFAIIALSGFRLSLGI